MGDNMTVDSPLDPSANLPATTSSTEVATVSAARRPGFPWRRFLTGVVVICSLMGFGWAFTQNKADEEHPLPAAVEAVDPAPDSPVVPAQSTITADLVFGYDSVLSIDGVELPLDQLSYITGQGIVSFTPGEGKEYRRFPGGTHVATVTYWPDRGATQDSDGRTFSWRFFVN